MNIGLLVIFCLQFVTEIIGVPYNMTETEEELYYPKLRIVAGKAAAKNSFPFQIAFTSRSPSVHNAYVPFCGGVLIALNKILSAAHCFETLGRLRTRRFVHWIHQDSLKDVYARAGELKTISHPRADSLETGQWRKLYNCRIPTSYYFPKDDIAVLIPFKQFFITPYVRHIRYARHFSDFIGPCYASGFGKTSWASRAVQANALMFAKMEVQTYDECINMEDEIGYLDVICALKHKDIGSGDSGGPLICYNSGFLSPKEPLLVGIISGKSKKTHSPLFTRVSSYMGFIERTPDFADESNGHKTNAKNELSTILTVISLICLHLS